MNLLTESLKQDPCLCYHSVLKREGRNVAGLILPNSIFFMKLSSKFLAVFTSSLGLVSINFAISLPAQAAIACESGTIHNYQNGSLATCILGQNTTVQVYSAASGTTKFECQAEKFISFDDKGQFASCQLAQELKLIKGNSIETCPAEYRINVSVSTEGIQSISCSPY